MSSHLELGPSLYRSSIGFPKLPLKSGSFISHPSRLSSRRRHRRFDGSMISICCGSSGSSRGSKFSRRRRRPRLRRRQLFSDSSNLCFCGGCATF